MINTTNIKIAKKYIDGLNEVFQDSDGYWAYTEKGFRFAETECHTAHGTTQKELLSDIRSLEPCDCEECCSAAVIEEAAPAAIAEESLQEEKMESYKVETICEMYGKNTRFISAHTPFDAAEKAASRMSWRQREQIKEQLVSVQDGTRRKWSFGDVHKLDSLIADEIEKRAL